MTDISKLRELLERVEKAEGPDRELDAEICVALSSISENMDRYISPFLVANGDRVALYAGPGKMLIWRRQAYPVTASINDAVALCKRVLPGFSYEIRESGSGDRGQATVWNPTRRPSEWNEHRSTNNSNPALALCSAILKAKIAERENA